MNDLEELGKRILIVDDELFVRNVLCNILSDKYICMVAESADEALKLIENNDFNLVLSDIDLGGMSGIEMVPLVHKTLPDAVVIMISGKQTIESAIEAMRVGAFDYIPKPFEIEQVELSVRKALNHQQLLVEKRCYDNHLEEVIKQRTERINYLAFHDILTDLPNRALFEDRLTQSLVRHNDKKTAVILFSIHRFKQLHETLGHEAGYAIIKNVAERLKTFIGENATVAKFESDEFAMLINNVKGAENIVQIINDINKTFDFPVEIDDREIFTGLDIGISMFPDDADNAADLMKDAGVALSRAVEHSGTNYEFYKTEMNCKALGRLELENNLRRAIEREELRVYYQPKIDTTSKQIVGMEALVRWQHPELGFISPAEFIPLAEETGIIVPLGEWVLRTACDQTKIWNEKGFPLNVSVNLSPEQFQQKGLAEMVMNVIEENSLDPSQIELEITETSIMKDADYVVKVLGELRSKGIKISIDDFGIGYSSFGYLKSLPIDSLKIDKSFIQDITTDPDAAALVMSIISLSHNLRLKIIAEGVETEDQLKFLHLLRCDAWQGYLYSKPVCAVDFEKLLVGERQALNN